MEAILTSAVDAPSRDITPIISMFPDIKVYSGIVGREAGLNCKGNYMLGSGHTGCGLSIYAIWEDFLQSREEWLFMFESDAEPLVTREEFDNIWKFRPNVKVAWLQYDDLGLYKGMNPRITPINKYWFRTTNPISFCAMAFHKDALMGFTRELRLPVDMLFLSYIKARRLPYATAKLFKHNDSTSNTRIDSGK